MFETLFNGLFPIFIGLMILHFVIFLVVWIAEGKNDEKYRGKIGIIRYYFYTWKTVVREAKDLYSYEEKEKEESNKD